MTSSDAETDYKPIIIIIIIIIIPGRQAVRGDSQRLNVGQSNCSYNASGGIVPHVSAKY